MRISVIKTDPDYSHDAATAIVTFNGHTVKGIVEADETEGMIRAIVYRPDGTPDYDLDAIKVQTYYGQVAISFPSPKP